MERCWNFGTIWNDVGIESLVQKILSVFKNEDEKLSRSQFQTVTKLSKTAVQDLLSEMTKRNILKRESKGQSFVYYLP